MSKARVIVLAACVARSVRDSLGSTFLFGSAPGQGPKALWCTRHSGAGDEDAIAQLVELAGEDGDIEQLPRLADAGSHDAADALAELEARSQPPLLARCHFGPSVHGFLAPTGISAVAGGGA